MNAYECRKKLKTQIKKQIEDCSNPPLPHPHTTPPYPPTPPPPLHPTHPTPSPITQFPTSNFKFQTFSQNISQPPCDIAQHKLALISEEEKNPILTHFYSIAPRFPPSSGETTQTRHRS